jgi:deoxyribodipyrimidine photolyase-related protein
MEIMQRAIDEYQASAGVITLPQVEGFVRQLLGWREYVRAIYWSNMPSYGSCNNLGANRQLPGFFWTGNTRMQCLAAAIGQSLAHAYAHHIQRLMVIGNFCLLTGMDPVAVDAWYLGIYIDGVEWVEMPNVRGMSLYADGGLLASKPYAAGGNYINRMSDYCKGCHYNVKDRDGDQACPFNSLYWRFMDLHRDQLMKNPRVAMIYRSWDRQPAEQRATILARAARLLDNIEQL